MWRYANKDTCNSFLLSLHLLKETDEKKYIKKLYSISNNIEKNYKIFKIKKHNGKLRTIYEPNRTLKYIQKQLLKNFLYELKVSSFATAYIPNKSITCNAIPHQNKKVLLKLDIKNFFENIDFLTIYKSCFNNSRLPKPIGYLLTKLCTYCDFLPQGAPTSAYISNLVMHDFDIKIATFCQTENISYTRYADDLTFSGDFNVSEVIKIVRKHLYPLHLELNNSKTKIITKNKRQEVTGIVVNDKIQINSQYRKKIRQEMYYIQKYGLDSHLKKLAITNKNKYIMQLYGKILYVLQIDKKNLEFNRYKLNISKLLSSRK